jgi:hypothetical protein
MGRLRRGTGWWLVAGALFLMQTGGQAEGRKTVTGPSQGAIPADYTLAAATGGGGGGGGTQDDGARGPSPEAGTGGTSRDGGSRPAPVEERNSPIDSRPRDPNAGGGGGGGGSGTGSNIVPALRGNPTGVDAVHEASPSPSSGGGGGGGGVPADLSPFIRVLPGGDAADWARSPSPEPR